jgi:ribosomal protein S18 acetylase RimI-like enzyme
MVETIGLRFAGPPDLPVCAAFWLAMFEEVGLLSESDFRPGWKDRFVEYFTGRIARGEARYSLAVEGETIVGTAGAVMLDGYPSAVHGMRLGYIFGVRVEPQYRGSGIATALTRDCVAFLKSLDCKRIRLHASSAGRPIYEKLGFEPTNEMQLPLRSA